jgi:signal transduction histidine kinase
LEAIEGDLEGLREQSDSDAELVQLGLAVAIINHEFEASIKSIRGSLRQLHQWARHNDEIAPLYSDIRASFDHLDGHLNLFTPLQRRLYRRPIEVKGSDIYHYLTTLFESRMTRHKVTIQATEAFLKAKMTGYPSSIYPVFVNIADNAIHWLKNRETDRAIVLDSEGQSFSVSNNGTSVHKRDVEGMFEQGFSRKPGGRGLGLFISRKALRREGMDLMYCPNLKDGLVTFKITWQKNEP